MKTIGAKSTKAISVSRIVNVTLRALLQAMAPLAWLICSLFLAQASAAKETTSAGIGVGVTWSTSWVDVSGDGRTDYCYLYGTDGDHIGCHNAQPDGTYLPTASLQQFIQRTSNGLMWWADVDGDGRPDLCRADAATTRFTSAYAGAMTGHVLWCLTAASSFTQGPPSTYAINENNPYAPWSRLMFTDVNGDQFIDLCQVTITVADQYGQVRCRLGSRTGFGDYSAKWTSKSIRLGNPARPSVLVDFNGDGFPDFCRVPDDSTLKCLLGAEDGFTTTDITSAVLDAGYVQGAEFVDINSDGKTDYCRITGPAGRYQLRCTLSNGVGWNVADDRMSPVIPDLAIGHSVARWWIDINADGLPDYCRATGAALNTDGVNDGTSTLLCRLNKGDGPATDAAGGFYYSDIELIQVSFGRGDTPRQWCDPTGSGFPTLCRNSLKRVYGTPVCEINVQGREICNTPVISTTESLITGFGADNTPQANHPLLTAYTDGLGAETRIGYLPLTSPDVYTRSGITNTERRFVGPPPTSPVVYETRAWMAGSTGAGSDLTGNARYFYGDLTNDPWAGTSRGFRERWMFSEGTNTIDHTVFFQGLGPMIDGSGSVENDLRETGMVKTQKRYAVSGGTTPAPGSTESGQSQRYGLLLTITGQAMKLSNIDRNDLLVPSSPFLLLQQTDNVLGDTSPANPRYRYIRSSSVRSYDFIGSGLAVLPTATTTTTQDNYGNVKRIEQTKTQNAASGSLTWTTTTENTYDSDPKWLRLGRLKKSTVTSSAPSLDAQIAANARSAGTSANASAVSSSLGAVGQEAPKPLPLPPQLLMPILQLLLED